MAGWRCAFCDPVRQLSSAIPTGVETRLAAVDGLQPETAVGTEWIYGVDDHCFWHTDLGVARGIAPRRPCCLGTCQLYRGLLDCADSCGRVLFFPRCLAQGNAISRLTRPPD